MAVQENEQEQEARLALEANLESDETLLSYSKGNIVSPASHHYVGLTGRRFILLPLKRDKPTGEVHNIWRDRVEEPKWTAAVAKFELPKDNFLLSFGARTRFRGRFWLDRGKAMAELTGPQTVTPMDDDGNLGQRQLQQARDYHKLGFPASAQVELATALQTDPNLGMDPLYKSLREQLTEDRLALKVGGAFFLGNIVIDWLILLIVLLVAGTEVLGDIVEFSTITSWLIGLWAGVRLWQGRTSWRTWGVVVAALGLIILGILYLLNGQLVDLVVQAAYSGSIILVLTGTSSRTRTWVATGIYVFGFLAITFLQLFGQFFGAF